MEAASQAGTLRRVTHRRPHVLLEWDSTQSKVVAAPSQVGMSRTQASTDASSRSHASRLVDCFDVPEEVFELSDLNDVLSMETWETCLTESERGLLSTYLPEGVDPESAVEALLSGENINFGNPLQTWGESVCAGAMHPDVLLHRELELKKQRKAYSKRLSNYHGNMVQNLQKMKGVWEACEDPEDFLPRIQRSMTSGRGTLIKNAARPHKRIFENTDFRKRHLEEIGEAIEDQQNDMSTRPKAKKRKVNKPLEEGSKRLKIMPPEGEAAKLKLKPSEGPNRWKIKSTGDAENFSIRPKIKGGKSTPPEEERETLKIRTSEAGTKRSKINSSEEGTKRPKVKPSEEGRNRLKIKPSEEGTKKPVIKPSEEGARRLKITTPSEGGTKKLQGKPPEEGTKKLEMMVSNEVNKGPKIKPPSKGVKRVKTKPAGNGTSSPEIKPPEEATRRLQIKPMDEGNETSARPKAKRQKVKPPEEETKVLESKRADKGTKKLQTKVLEAGRKVPQIKPQEEERDPPSRPKAKRTAKVKPLEKEVTMRMTMKPPVEGPKRLKVRSTQDGARIQNIEPSEEGTKIPKRKSSGGGAKRSMVKSSGEGPQRPIIKSSEKRNDLPPRPKETRWRAKPQAQGTKSLKVKPSGKGREDFDLANSDFEGEWFKKYVQVTIGPLSGHKLSKAIQSVKVTSRMFEDVKRRSEAGEEVHLDSLDPMEGRSSDKKPPKKVGGPSGNEVEVVARFWQTVLLKDLPIVHANFMERKELQQKLAMSLASTCKNLWEIEVDNTEPVQEEGSPSGVVTSSLYGDASPSGGATSSFYGDAMPSGGYTSPIYGDASPTGDDAWPSGGEASPSVGEASPHEGEASPSVGEASPNGGFPSGGDDSQSGGEASPSGGKASPSGGEDPSSGGEDSPSGGEDLLSGGEVSPSGGEALLSGDEPWPNDDEALPNRDEAFPSGDEAFPSGDEAFPSGDDPLPSGDDALSSGDEASRSGGEASPSEADPKEARGINFKLLTPIEDDGKHFGR